MIRVEPQPEPPDFDRKVRQPGRRALAEGRKTTYWRECIEQLFQAYGGVCAYLAIRIPRGTGAPTVDHFAPRIRRRELTYEWSNFRLVCSLMNSRKHVFEDVLDPFEIEDGWFTLEPSSLEVLPNPKLDPSLGQAVQQTIDRLKLNDPECLAARAEHYDDYLQGDISFDRLRRWSPFVAKELIRQGLVSSA